MMISYAHKHAHKQIGSFSINRYYSYKHTKNSVYTTY